MTTKQHNIQTCIARCASAKDGRGRWRACRECVDRLTQAGNNPAIAQDTAAAARRMGEWLATYPASRLKVEA